MKLKPFEIGYYEAHELKKFGFNFIGSNVKISKNCVIKGLDKITIGDNVIIDAFCSIIVTGDGYLEIGSYIHIGAFSHILACKGVEIKDFSGVSQGVKIYNKTDDYSGNSLTNPTIPNEYKSLKTGKVIINEHVIVGAGSVLLPNIVVGEGVSIGALSLVSTNLAPWTMYYGNPLRKLAKRSKKLLQMKEEFLYKNSIKL